MKKIHIIIITFTLLCSACNPQPSHSTKAISTEDAQSKSRIDTTLIGRIFGLLSFGERIEDLKIEIVQLDKCRLFWSDPGYIRGPEIAIEDTCCAVSFTTHTFNLGDGGYSDDYVLYFPFHKKFGILYNRYYGKNYHGGSLKVVPDSTDRSFEALQSALVHKKDKIWYQIEQEIQKKRNEISAAPIPLRSI